MFESEPVRVAFQLPPPVARSKLFVPKIAPVPANEVAPRMRSFTVIDRFCRLSPQNLRSPFSSILSASKFSQVSIAFPGARVKFFIPEVLSRISPQVQFPVLEIFEAFV